MTTRTPKHVPWVTIIAIVAAAASAGLSTAVSLIDETEPVYVVLRALLTAFTVVSASLGTAHYISNKDNDKNGQ